MKLKTSLAHGASSIAFALSLVAGGGVVSAAHAQTEAGSRLEEIVVTARKQEESLNSIPLAVSAFSSGQIEARGLATLVDVSNFTPGFKFQNQTGGGSGRNDRTINVLIFRGLALTNDSGTRAGSLLFVDGAPIIGGAAPGLTDIERVEVLRGPQSAFFGRSTFSGAVNYVTKDPPKYWTVKGSASYASYESHTESISVGGPIAGDTLRARVSFTNDDAGGHWNNFASPFESFGDRRTTSGSVQVIWEPTSNLRMKGSFTAFENEDGPPAQAAIKQDGMNCNLNPATVPNSYTSLTPAAGNPQVANPQAGNRYYCGAIPEADKLPASTISANYVIDPLVRSSIIGNRSGFPLPFNPDFLDHGGLRKISYISSLRIEYDNLPFGLSFGSTTSFHQEKTMAILDLDFRDGRNRPNPLFNPAAANPSNPFFQFTLGYQTKTRDFSQEFRLTSDASKRFHYVVGVNYISADDRQGTVYGQSVLGSTFSAALSKFHPETPSVFGAAYFDITPQLQIIGEARYQVDKVRQDSLTSTTGAALVPPIEFEEEYKSFSPRITLNFKPVDGTLMYALFSRGYRPGGFNTGLSPRLAAPQLTTAALAGGYNISYDQERLDNYEVGVKTRLFDGRVQLNADAYYDKYSQGQISQTVTYFTSTGSLNQSTLIKNVGEIELRGIEGELQWQVVENLLLSATFAMNDSEVKKGFCSDCTTIFSAPNGASAAGLNNDLVGKRLTIAPKYTATFSGEYSHTLVGSYDWFARGDYAYRGKQFIDQANVAWVGTKHILNLRTGVRNDNYSAELFCTNCLDDLTADSAVYASTDLFTAFSGARQEIRYGLPQRRMVGVKVAATFGGEPPPRRRRPRRRPLRPRPRRPLRRPRLRWPMRRASSWSTSPSTSMS